MNREENLISKKELDSYIHNINFFLSLTKLNHYEDFKHELCIVNQIFNFLYVNLNEMSFKLMVESLNQF